MRPSHIPRPEPTWLDWVRVALFILFLVVMAVGFAGAGDMPEPG